jgi:hypothetical protein
MRRRETKTPETLLTAELRGFPLGRKSCLRTCFHNPLHSPPRSSPYRDMQYRRVVYSKREKSTTERTSERWPGQGV